jgi:phenylpyruvate tautomerase PptA (4-oxalocrotonate tautomerase family)
MPYLKLQTNKQLSKDKKDQVLQDLTALLSKDLSKPEKYIMIECNDDQSMFFGGSDEYLVFIDLRSINLPEESTSKLSASLANFVKSQLEIKPERVFINFTSYPRHMWGFNGTTF